MSIASELVVERATALAVGESCACGRRELRLRRSCARVAKSLMSARGVNNGTFFTIECVPLYCALTALPNAT